MDRLSKTQGVNCGKCQARLVGFVFVITSLCVAFPALAAATLTDSAMADIAYASNIAELEVLPEVTAHAGVLTDIGLSEISGRGAEATKLEGIDKFAVLLWDERGNGGKRPAGHDIEAGSGFQTVNSTINFTVNRR